MSYRLYRYEAPARALAAARTKGLEQMTTLTLAQMLQSAYLQGFTDCYEGTQIHNESSTFSK